MSSNPRSTIHVPVLFACTRGDTTVRATQYIEMPAYSTIDDVRAAARRVLDELMSGELTRFSSSLPTSAGAPLLCGFEILPITAIARD